MFAYYSRALVVHTNGEEKQVAHGRKGTFFSALGKEGREYEGLVGFFFRAPLLHDLSTFGKTILRGLVVQHNSGK